MKDVNNVSCVSLAQARRVAVTLAQVSARRFGQPSVVVWSDGTKTSLSCIRKAEYNPSHGDILADSTTQER